jgi:hypothetical protein
MTLKRDSSTPVRHKVETPSHAVPVHHDTMPKMV